MSLADLPFATAVYLLAILRDGLAADGTHLRPLNTLDLPFCPTLHLQRLAIVERLWWQHFLWPDVGSPPHAFCLGKDGKVALYYDRVQWLIGNFDELQSLRALRQELERSFRDEDWPDHWPEDVVATCMEVQAEECVESFAQGLSERRIPFTREADARELFSDLLAHFSPAQLHYFIWRAVRMAGDKVQTGAAKSRTHPENSALHFIRTAADRAANEKTGIPPYRRASPQSLVSTVLFTNALKINDEAFNTRPDAFEPPFGDDDLAL